MLATPVHPVLLAMPYLTKAECLVPLDQMLEDQMLEEQMLEEQMLEEQMLEEQMLEFPLAEELVGPMCSAGLEQVAESKDQADLNVWKYSPERTLVWLEGRASRVAAVLERQGIDLTGGATSLNYRPAGAVEPGTGESWQGLPAARARHRQ